jgi:hypothetical protein
MKSADLFRLVLVFLLIAPGTGCYMRLPALTAPTTDPTSPPPSSQPGTSAVPQVGNLLGLGATKYYASIKREAVDLVMSAGTDTEDQVMALLGEPSQRSETRHYTDRHGKFEEYDLWWLKAPGQPLVKVTFLNGYKTTVISGAP